MSQIIKQATSILDTKAGSGVAAALRSLVMVFVDANLINPTFDSQTKVRTCSHLSSFFSALWNDHDENRNPDA
jgi:hypothetical protein